jgi:hypothetical protein
MGEGRLVRDMTGHVEEFYSLLHVYCGRARVPMDHAKEELFQCMRNDGWRLFGWMVKERLRGYALLLDYTDSAELAVQFCCTDGTGEFIAAVEKALVEEGKVRVLGMSPHPVRLWKRYGYEPIGCAYIKWLKEG